MPPAIEIDKSASKTAPAGERFFAPDWLQYFESNRLARAGIRVPAAVDVSSALREPLIRSLQRFQIGETGEGRHLKKYAATTGDADYVQCIDLFIKEEQGHARLLADVLAALDATLLTWHWTDLAFICLRRMLGLKTELFILLIAEIIGKCFYSRLAHNLEDDRLRNIFTFIVLDEIAHLEFHCSFLQTKLNTLPARLNNAVHAAWAAIFFFACWLFVIDHRKTLKELGTTPLLFVNDCARVFAYASRRAFPSLGSPVPGQLQAH